MPVVDVVSGVLRRADGKVLLSQRPQGKLSAGLWEIPGGKVEAGERAEVALARELREELGIEIESAQRWTTYEHAYPDKVIRVQVFRVTAWRGSLHGREGQTVAWEGLQASTKPFLPAQAKILSALQLPTLCAFSDAGRLGVTEFLQRLENGLRTGVRIILVSEPWMARGQLAQFSRRVMAAAYPYGAEVLVDADESVVRLIGCDGMLSGVDRLARMSRRPALRMWGAACANRTELLRAAALGVDFVVLRGPAGSGFDWAKECSAAVFAPADSSLPAAAAGSAFHGIDATALVWGQA